MVVGLGVRCIVRMGDGAVMVRHLEPNPHRTAQDFWVLPGGGVEPAEGVFAAAEREVLEETGLVVRGSRFFTCARRSGTRPTQRVGASRDAA